MPKRIVSKSKFLRAIQLWAAFWMTDAPYGEYTYKWRQHYIRRIFLFQHKWKNSNKIRFHTSLSPNNIDTNLVESIRFFQFNLSLHFYFIRWNEILWPGTGCRLTCRPRLSLSSMAFTGLLYSDFAPVAGTTSVYNSRLNRARLGELAPHSLNDVSRSNPLNNRAHKRAN